MRAESGGVTRTSGTLGRDGNACYSDHGDGFTGVYLFQTLKIIRFSTFEIGAVYCAPTTPKKGFFKEIL